MFIKILLLMRKVFMYIKAALFRVDMQSRSLGGAQNNNRGKHFNIGFVKIVGVIVGVLKVFLRWKFIKWIIHFLDLNQLEFDYLLIIIFYYQ